MPIFQERNALKRVLLFHAWHIHTVPMLSLFVKAIWGYFTVGVFNSIVGEINLFGKHDVHHNTVDA